MREILLFQRINRSYKTLNLRYSKLAAALLLMLLASVLEIGSLSMLYPLVLALGSGGRLLSRFNGYIPAGHPFLLDPKNQIVIIFCGLALLFVLKNIVLYFSYRHDVDFAMYYYRNLIRGLYSAYIHKSLIEFRKDSSGALANVICVQSERLMDGVIRPTLIIIAELFLLVSISTLLLWVNPWLVAGVILTCGSAIGVYYLLLHGKAVKWGEQRMAAASALHELVHNTALGVSEIKVFGKEDYLVSRIDAAAHLETSMFHNWDMYKQGPRYLLETVFVASFAFFFCVFLLAGTDISVLLASFSVVAASAFRILPCVIRIAGSYSCVSYNTGSALALMEVISHLGDSLGARARGIVAEPVKRFGPGPIEVRDVSFSYPSAQEPILKGVSLVIGAGERVGIVGASGSGKSTLIELLAALYAPSSGALIVDGADVSKHAKSWQEGIGYVPQVPFIMPGTIRENVAFALDGVAAGDQVWAALERVGLAAFVSSLPHGLDAVVGERGLGLSGGQKQLLCMARALFRNPGVFLLDEPTASLDRESERVILETIRTLSRDMTVVMVSHKRENFSGFDTIYLCDRGSLTRQAPVAMVSGTA